MTYKIVTDREMALERENARLVDKTERQSATIHVQAVAIQAMKEEIAASERNLEQLTDELAQSRAEIAKLKTSFMDGFEGGKQEARDSAQEEIEALKADAERLDWLEKTQSALFTCTHTEWKSRTDGTSRRDGVLVFDGWCANPDLDAQPTPREAINAAMKESK